MRIDFALSEKIATDRGTNSYFGGNVASRLAPDGSDLRPFPLVGFRNGGGDGNDGSPRPSPTSGYVNLVGAAEGARRPLNYRPAGWTAAN